MNNKILVKSILVLLVLSLATVFTAVELLRTKTSEAQVLSLPDPTQLVPMSASFAPSVLKGVRFNHENPLQLEFLIDSQDSQVVSEKTAQRLVHYFLAALTVPEGDMWVNLSPYEEERIVPESLGQTDLGKDLLAQDYILKQLSSSLTHPDTDLGEEYWKNILGDGDLAQQASNEFNKVWIMPNKADLVEYKSSAYVREASLKVLTQQDYTARAENRLEANADKQFKSIKDLIIPKLEDDINNGENFSRLRQIYNSLILASWFKTKYQKSVFQYYIDQNKIGGIDIADKSVKKKIWSLYCDSFNKGVYNAIRPYEYSQKKVKRTFFSGGIEGKLSSAIKVTKTDNVSDVPLPENGYTFVGEVNSVLESKSTSSKSNLGSVNAYLADKLSFEPLKDGNTVELQLDAGKEIYKLFIGGKLIKDSAFDFDEDEESVVIEQIYVDPNDLSLLGKGIGKQIFDKISQYCVLKNKDLVIGLTSNYSMLKMAENYAGEDVSYKLIYGNEGHYPQSNNLQDLLSHNGGIIIRIQGQKPIKAVFEYDKKSNNLTHIKTLEGSVGNYLVRLSEDNKIQVIDRLYPSTEVKFDVNLGERSYEVTLPHESLKKNVGGIDLNYLTLDTEIETFDKVFVPFDLRSFDGFAFMPIELKKLDSPMSFVPHL